MAASGSVGGGGGGVSRHDDDSEEQRRKQDISRLATSLLSGPNAELFHRYEAEEGRAHHLKAKARAQEQAIAALQRELRDVQEAHSVAVAQQVGALHDRQVRMRELEAEEGRLDAAVAAALSRIEALAATVSSVKLQLAHGFQLHGALSGAREIAGLAAADVVQMEAEMRAAAAADAGLSPDELPDASAAPDDGLDEVGDESLSDEEAGDAGSTDRPATDHPSATEAAKLAARQATSRAARRQEVSRRAAVIVLSQAREALVQEAAAVELLERAGHITTFEADRRRLAIEARIEEARARLRAAAGGSADPDVLLGCAPAAPSSTLDASRDARRDVAAALSKEEALLRSKEAHSCVNDWVEAVNLHDDEQFALSRMETTAATTAPAPKRRTDVGKAAESDAADDTKSATTAPNRPSMFRASESLRPLRCASAKQRRYLEAATRTLSAADRDAPYFSALYASEAPPNPAQHQVAETVRRPTSAFVRYHLRAHDHLEDAAMATVKLNATSRRRLFGDALSYSGVPLSMIHGTKRE